MIRQYHCWASLTFLFVPIFLFVRLPVSVLVFVFFSVFVFVWESGWWNKKTSGGPRLGPCLTACQAASPSSPPSTNHLPQAEISRIRFPHSIKWTNYLQSSKMANWWEIFLGRKLCIGSNLVLPFNIVAHPTSHDIDLQNVLRWTKLQAKGRTFPTLGCP